jgi:hypothetical protein
VATPDLTIDVWTEAALRDSAVAVAFFDGWKAVLPPLEYFGLGEPIRRKIAVEGPESVIACWAASTHGIMFRRGTKPRAQVDFSWDVERGKRVNPYPWRCTVWLQPAVEEKVAEECLRMVAGITNAAFGSATLESDFREKHRVEFESRPGVVASKLMGQEPLVDRLPGVYWRTWIGAPYVKLLGRERIRRLEVGAIEEVGQGALLKPFEHLSMVGSAAALQQEEAVRRGLGADRFFTKGNVDVDALRTPPARAAKIEEALSKMKATGEKTGHVDET